MFDHKAPNPTTQEINKLLNTSIEKITKKIAESGTEFSIDEEDQRSSSHHSIDVSENKSFIKRQEKIEVQSSYSKVSRNQQSNVNSSKLTIKIQEKLSQRQLSQKARNFVAQLRSRRKQIEGQFILKKITEQKRKKESQKKKEVQQRVEKQIQKQIRKLKAQKNIEYFKQKRKLYLKSSNSLTVPRKRAESKAVSRQSRNSFLPPIYARQDLQQIQQEPTTRKSPLKTVLKTKRRSHTVADIRDDESHNSESTQIKLFDQSQKRNKIDRYSSFNNNLNLRSSSNSRRYQDDDKKCYLMSRNNTDDISEYLQKYSNFKQIKSSNINFSERNRRQKIANKRKLTKSSLYMDEFEKQIQEEDV